VVVGLALVGEVAGAFVLGHFLFETVCDRYFGAKKNRVPFTIIMPLDRKSQSSSFVALPPSLPFDDPNYFVVNPLAPSVMAPVSYGSQAALDVSSDLALSPGLVDHYCSPSASEVINAPLSVETDPHRSPFATGA